MLILANTYRTIGYVLAGVLTVAFVIYLYLNYRQARPETGAEIRIDCTAFGSGSYSIPHSVEHLKFETKAKFILCIETGGMFQRL